MSEDSFKSEIREVVVDPLKRAGEITKEGLIDTKDALLASGKVLSKNIQEFANSLGLHLPEQSPIPVKDRIYPAVATAALGSFFTVGGGLLGMGILKGVETGRTEAVIPAAVAGLVHLALGGLTYARAYGYAMGKEDFWEGANYRQANPVSKTNG